MKTMIKMSANETHNFGMTFSGLLRNNSTFSITRLALVTETEMFVSSGIFLYKILPLLTNILLFYSIFIGSNQLTERFSREFVQLWTERISREVNHILLLPDTL